MSQDTNTTGCVALLNNPMDSNDIRAWKNLAHELEARLQQADTVINTLELALITVTHRHLTDTSAATIHALIEHEPDYRAAWKLADIARNKKSTPTST